MVTQVLVVLKDEAEGFTRKHHTFRMALEEKMVHEGEEPLGKLKTKVLRWTRIDGLRFCASMRIPSPGLRRRYLN